MALGLLDAAVPLLSVRELVTRDMSLQTGLLFFPAPTWLVLACAAFAVVWGVTRTVWGAKLLRSSRATPLHPDPCRRSLLDVTLARHRIAELGHVER